MTWNARSLDRIEWLFPLTGRWRRHSVRVTGCVLLVVGLLQGLLLAEVVPHLASAKHLRMERSSCWRVREYRGRWGRAGAPFVLEFGPLRFRYTYPPRGCRNRAETPVRWALQLGTWGVVLGLARMWIGDSLKRLAPTLTIAGCILLFPLAIACGPMGCENVTPGGMLCALYCWYTGGISQQ
jgi:hypothetical protein